MARVNDLDWNVLTTLIRSLDPGVHARRPCFSDATIVLVLVREGFFFPLGQALRGECLLPQHPASNSLAKASKSSPFTNPSPL